MALAVCVGERGLVSLGEQLAADGDELSPSPCGQKAEMADAHKATRQHMQQEPTQEFVGRDGHFALLVAVGVIFPSERDLAVGQGHESVVGNGHAMRVAGQILEYVFRSAEWWLGVDDPILPEQLPQKGTESGLGSAQVFEISMEAELLLTEEALQTSNELAAKDAAEYLYRKEEMVFGMNPARVVWRKTAGWNDAVHVGMRLQVLPPGVKHTEEADLRAEMFRIGGDLESASRRWPGIAGHRWPSCSVARARTVPEAA